MFAPLFWHVWIKIDRFWAFCWQNHPNITISLMIWLVRCFNFQSRLNRYWILHVLYNIPHQSWRFHPVLPIDCKYLKITNMHFLELSLIGDVWVRLRVFFESVLIKKLAVFFSQHLGGNNSLIVHFFVGWPRSIFLLPQVNDSVLGNFSGNRPYVWWLQNVLI